MTLGSTGVSHLCAIYLSACLSSGYLLPVRLFVIHAEGDWSVLAFVRQSLCGAKVQHISTRLGDLTSDKLT